MASEVWLQAADRAAKSKPMNASFTTSSAEDREAPGWLVIVGRAGLAARGVVYLLVGTLATMAGIGLGGKIVDQRDAVASLGSSPVGTAALWIVGGGLAGYALWRFAQVLAGESKLGKRVVALVSGIAYSGLAATALGQGVGQARRSRGSSGHESEAAWLMAQPFGRWLVAAVALAIFGAAIFQFYRAITASFAKHLQGGTLSPAQELWSRRAGRVGYSARGVAFALIGWFFLQAAMHRDASEAGGLALALRTLASQPHGPTLLAIVGAGLGLFGIYSMVEARFRRIS